MQYKESFGRKFFLFFNYTFIIAVALLCLFPVINILAISFSSAAASEAGIVKLWPVDFTLQAYRFVINEHKFYTSFFVTIKRLGIGVPVNMLLTLLAAYPISKSNKVFKFKQAYVWYFMVTILFGGGLIPTYLVVRYLGLIDKIWALIIPSAVPVFNIILLQNFFKALPQEIEDAAFMDGAGHWTALFKIYLPLSKPAIATLTLFCSVGHWNAWFDGMIYMNRAVNYPLQTYLQTVIVQRNIDLITLRNIEDIMNVCEKNSRAAQIFVAMAPILLIYPFVQKFFSKGIIYGSVKG